MATGKFEALFLNILANLNPQISHYCDIETVDGNGNEPDRQIIVYQDGTCASIIKLNGIKSILDGDTFEEYSLALARTLEPFLRLKGHQVQFFFRRDLDATDQLQSIGDIQRDTAKKLHLDVEDLIQESVLKYSEYVYEEECYIVLFSRPNLLDKVEFKMDRDSKNEIKKKYHWPSTSNGQNLLRPISYLYERHLAFVSRVMDDLSGDTTLGVSLVQLDIYESFRAIKRVSNRNSTSSKWRIRIPGNGLSPRWNETDNIQDGGSCLYPTIPEQILNEPALLGKNSDKTLPDNEFIKIGDRVYAPLIITVPPRSDRDIFNDLFNTLNRADTKENGETRAMPYSISFMLEGDGMGFTVFKSIFAGILAFTSEQNRNINSAMSELREYIRDSGCVIKLKIAMMTWSHNDQESIQELQLRKNKLKNAIESWGGAAWKAVSGDPAEPWQTNNLALSPKHIGTPCAAPLEAAVRLLPTTRPASVFENGTILHRSLDGTIMPLERFSSEQTTWITLVTGKPGSGKSVLMNNLNFEACLAAGVKRLPYIGIVDIGVSSAGFTDLISDALPPNMKHLVSYRRLQNSETDGINILDTPLCQRFPLQRDLEFKTNFITTLVTPSEANKPEPGMSGLVTAILKKSYETYQDDNEKGRARKYSPGQVPLIDEALKSLEFVPTNNTTYWELVDLFFDNAMYYECEVAQRLAVPILQELVGIANSPEIKSEYEDQEGDRLRNLFIRGIRDAINQYPIFRSSTQFDIGSARIVSFDLQDVAAKDKTLASVKQTTLMYMIARQSFMQKIAYSKEDLAAISPRARPYFEKLVNELADEEKILMYDEFHKTQLDGASDEAKLSPLQQQVITDGREGRKWKLEIVLGSQYLSDYGNLVTIATNIYLLDATTPVERKKYRDIIGISSAAEKALAMHVHGPTRHGTSFLAIISTKKGKYCQLYTLSLGPMRLWSLSTTAEDRKMRELFYSSFATRQEARQALALYFPEGGCKSLIDREKQRLEDKMDLEENNATSIIEEIGKECIADYYNRISTFAGKD